MTDPHVPDSEDLALDEMFAALPGFAPRDGFEDRVMARVRAPSPLWLQRLQTRVRIWVESGRSRRLARALVGSSVISITLVAALLATNAGQVSGFLSAQFGSVALGIWRGILGIGSTMLQTVYGAVGGAPSGGALVAAALAGAALMVLNAWALYRLMQPRRSVAHAGNALRP